MQVKTENARYAASVRWKDANALQPHNKRIANGMQNDAIRVEKKREEKNNANSHFSDEKKQPILHKGQTLRDKEILDKMKNDPLFDPFDDTPTGDILPPGEGMVF